MPDAIGDEAAKAQAKLDFCRALQDWGGAMASLRNASLASAVATIKRVLGVADLSTVTGPVIAAKIEGLSVARQNAAAAFVVKLNADLIAIGAAIDAGQIPANAVNPL
jgi:hypothetical protein